MSDEFKSDDGLVASTVNVENLRAVRLELKVLDTDKLAEGTPTGAVYLGVVYPAEGGNIWYKPTLLGFELADISEAAAKELDRALREWDAAKAEGGLMLEDQAKAMFAAGGVAQ